MTQTHLSEKQLDGLRQRSLSPSELPAAMEHLAICAECQDHMRSGVNFSKSVTELQRTFERHLSESELIDCVGKVIADDAFVRAHLEQCSTCVEELRELRSFSVKVRSPILTRGFVIRSLLIAAGLLLLAFLTFPLLTKESSVVNPAIVERP